jgi:hypothetical protein
MNLMLKNVTIFYLNREIYFDQIKFYVSYCVYVTIRGKGPYQLCVHDTDIWFANPYLRDEAQSISVPVAYLLPDRYPLPAPPTKNLTFNTKQYFYYISKKHYHSSNIKR